MIRNYLITAYRNLQRNKVYAILNIAGLALGIGCALVIYKLVDYELSFDQHHSSYDNIYRVVRINEGDSFDSRASHPLAVALREEFPSIKVAASIDYQESIQIN